MNENKIILSTNMIDMLRDKITPGTQPVFECMGTHIPIIENKSLERNSMIATGEAAELFFKAFLGMIN